MKNTTTLNRLTDKPLNAKYYPYDFDDATMVDSKKENIFVGLSRFIAEILAKISRQ